MSLADTFIERHSVLNSFVIKWAPILWMPILIAALEVVLTFSIGSLLWRIIIGGGLVLIFAAYHYASVFPSFERFQRFEAAKRELLDDHIGAMLERPEVDYEMRVNVMIAPKSLFGNRKRLKPEWVSPNMRQDSDRDLTFARGQGVCGEAFQEGEMTFSDLTTADLTTFDLNEDQMKASEELQFVLSFPIRTIDLETGRLTNEIIGVVNFDSRTKGSERLITDPEKRENLEEKAKDLSEFCSKLF